MRLRDSEECWTLTLIEVGARVNLSIVLGEAPEDFGCEVDACRSRAEVLHGGWLWP